MSKPAEVPDWLRDMEDPQFLSRRYQEAEEGADYMHRQMRDPKAAQPSPQQPQPPPQPQQPPPKPKEDDEEKSVDDRGAQRRVPRS